MRFMIAESMCDVRHFLPLAERADQAGFATFALGDSILYPEKSSAKYPYTSAGDRSFLDGAPFLDPFQLFAAMSVVTRRLEFLTGVLKLPVRDPVLVAKQVSSLAVLSNERFVFGVGLSVWPEDFEACGQDWETRGPRMDEAIQIVRGLMSGEYFAWHGQHYEIPRIKLCPTPAKCPPIVIGGHSAASLRRAARLADGYYFVSVSEPDLARAIATLRSLRREAGREREPFRIYAGMPTPSVGDLRRLEDLGITDLSVSYRNLYAPDRMTLQEKLDWLSRFGDEVIAKA